MKHVLHKQSLHAAQHQRHVTRHNAGLRSRHIGHINHVHVNHALSTTQATHPRRFTSHVLSAFSEQKPVAPTASSAPTVKRRRSSKANVLLQLQQQFKNRFFIPHTEVNAFTTEHDLTIEQFLQALLTTASALAHTPISAYNVGAAGLGKSGSVYIGVNLEFPDRPLNSSVHAEQCLVTNAVLHGERALQVLAVSAAPCGHCRQFFCELPDAGSVRFIFGKQRGRRPVMTLERLLPLRFGPDDLLDEAGAPRMLDQQTSAPSLTTASLKAGDSGLGAPDEGLVEAALARLRQSYAPYTRCHAAVALRLRGGQVVAGPYLESAAYNPSLGPMQAAVVAAVVSGLQDYTEIEQAVLVESGSGRISHAEDVRVLLSKCNPAVHLRVMHY